MLNMQSYLFNGMGGVHTCFPTQKTGVDIVNNLVTFAIYRVRPHPNPSECLFQASPP